MVGVLSTAVLYTNNYSHITRRYALHRVIIFFFCLQMGRVNLVVIRIFWLFNLHYPKYRRSISTGNILVSLINTISTWLAEGNKLGVKEIGSQYPYL